MEFGQKPYKAGSAPVFLCLSHEKTACQYILLVIQNHCPTAFSTLKYIGFFRKSLAGRAPTQFWGSLFFSFFFHLFPRSRTQQKNTLRILHIGAFCRIIVLPNRASTINSGEFAQFMPVSVVSKNTLCLCLKTICHKFEIILKY
ncbi:hypothetical protein CWM52_05470 [Raoultella sp. T31]|nr:hypothetical protein CWM52_05470 [Raoultella sp. T31]